MSATDVLSKLDEASNASRDALKSGSAPKFMSEIIAGEKAIHSAVADLTKTDDDNSAWEAQWASETPDEDKLRKARLRVAFQLLFRQEMRSQYMSGSDGHSLTDVDPMRERVTPLDNWDLVSKDLKAVLED